MAQETIKVQEQKIRELLRKYLHSTIGRNHDAFIDILEIMMAQDQWLDKLNTIQTFKITRSKLNKAIILQVKVDNFSRWLTVSWRKGSGKKRRDEDPLQSSFRQAVYRQILSWKRNNSLGAMCTECKDVHHSHLKLHADHKNPSFLQLTKNFLEKSINKPSPVEFDYHYKCGRKFKKQDNKFKKRWQNYHKKYATLQWLCRRCNLSKKKK